MAAAGKSSLEHTPTWSVATVCLIMLILSFLIEHSIHLLTHMLKRRRKTALYDAVDRIKSELMLLGFISLLLAATQDSISNICVSKNIAQSMLPCALKEANLKLSTKENYEQFGRRNLLSNMDHGLVLYNGNFRIPHRSLIVTDDHVDVADQSVVDNDSCIAKGKVSLITPKGIHQLQIFVIVLAVMQTVNSVLTVALGKAKMWHWKAWEKETQTVAYLIENDPNRFSFTRQTLFGRRHETFTETSIHLWIKCFFRQFFHSVAKVDYHTIRRSFIAAHMSSKGKKFNFQKYIVRSLEEDFKVVVSIRPYMWCMVVTFLLVDVHGWHAYYLWVSLVPFLMVLLLGTKLETIVARMALRLKNQNPVIQGIPVVQPNDDLFWFQQPRFVLALLHLALFLNAFQLAFFLWLTIQFGLDSCYHEHTLITLARIGLAVVVQVLCSYITLPLYALVTQMGESHYKNKVLEEQLAKMLKQWHAEVRAKRRNQQLEQSLQSSSTSLPVDLSFRDIALPPDFSSHNNIPTSTTSTESNIQVVSKRDGIIEEEEEIVEETAISIL